MREIGEGLYPDEPRVKVEWLEKHPTETPIVIQHGYLRGTIAPAETVILPLNVAAMLRDESGYDVIVTGEPAPDADEGIEAAVEGVELHARAQALIGQSVDKLRASLVDADLALLIAAHAAELAEGEGKTRSTALKAIEEAITARGTTNDQAS